MYIVFLDAYTMNPGDINFGPLAELGNFVAYDRTSVEETAARAGTAEVVIVNKFPVNEATLEKMPNLQYICVAATGYNNIDLDAVKRRGIPVSNVRDYSTDSVAQHVFASILSWYNNIEHYNLSVKNGDWSRQDDFCYFHDTIYPVKGLTLGIAGFGSIGQKVATIGKVFGMNIITYSRSMVTSDIAQQVDQDTFFAESDIITLHMPLSEDTRHWIQKTTLAKMKKTGLLINTARGPLVDVDALLEALQQNLIAGAILDVLDQEPPKQPHPIIYHPRCWVTPHIAWAGLEARKKLLVGIRDNILAFREGKWNNPIYTT